MAEWYLYQKCKVGFTFKNQSKEERKYDCLNRYNKLHLTPALGEILNVFPQIIEQIKNVYY